MMRKKSLKEVRYKIDKIVFKEEFDLVVGVARGGIIPGFLLARRLKVELGIIWLKYRDDDNKIVYKKPKLMSEIKCEFKDKKLLRVDDVSRTGATFKAAKGFLRGAREVKTLVVNGKEDYWLYDEECFSIFD